MGDDDTTASSQVSSSSASSSPRPPPSLLSTLRPEFSGSQWPKLTLACLREGYTLTWQQLKQITQIIDTFTFSHQQQQDQGVGMRACSDADPSTSSDHHNNNIITWSLPVHTLSLVRYRCRSLQRLAARIDIDWPNISDSDSHPHHHPPVPAPISPSESHRSLSVLSELGRTDEELQRYLPRINELTGREGHYQGEHEERTLVLFANKNCRQNETASGKGSAASAAATSSLCTMTSPLSSSSSSSPSSPPPFLSSFHSAIDALLPGYYIFFPWDTLHCTTIGEL